MILSILIPTVEGREKQLNKLLSYLKWQIDYLGVEDKVQVLTEWDKKEMTIGAKRNLLLSKAKGIYSWQIDDDDWISDNAIELILKAAEDNSDCIGFKEICIMGQKAVKTSNFSLRYQRWVGKPYDQFDHVRTPFCKTPIKTELARSVKFRDERYQEDEHYANDIKPLLRTESYIDEFIYIYRYKYEPHKTKYGYAS